MRTALDPFAVALAGTTHSRPSTSTAPSVDNSLGKRVLNIAMSQMPKAEIELETQHGVHGSWVTSFSTMDTIKGEVVITPERDTPFDTLDITFVGICKTWVDRLASSPAMGGGRSTATHRFLRLIQPINEDDLPCPRVFQAGMTYRFPFTFVVPQQLLPRSCVHHVDNPAVRDAHMLLPPSMGDPEVAGFGGTLMDDMAPEMAKILYVVKVRAVRSSLSGAEDVETVVIDRVRKLRIKPAYDEQPPLSAEYSADYRVRQEKSFRRRLFKSKAGSLVMETSQPRSLRIPGARTDGLPAISTVAKAVVRFDPSDESSAPPRLSSLTSKLKVGTYHSSTPRNSFPHKKNLAYDATQGFYSESVPLSSRCVANTPWVKHEASENPAISRRDSGASISEAQPFTGIPAPSSTYANGSFYTATITVPVTLPTDKNFLPTFHSCLISRVYALGLDLTTQSSGGSSTTLSLKVPIQVSSETSAEGLELMRGQAEDQQAIEDEVNRMFTPRGTSPTSQLSPAYEATSPAYTPIGTAPAPVPTAPPRTDSPPSYTYHAPRGSVGVRTAA